MPAFGRFVLCLLFMLGVVPDVDSRTLAAQEIALAARGPRFLMSTPPSGRVIEVDADRHAVLRRTVSLTIPRPTVGGLLASIEAQTGLRFAFDRAVLPPDRPVALHAETITLGGALLTMLMDTGLDVLLSSGRQVAFVRRTAGPQGVQGGAVIGRVTDAKSGNGIGGVDVALDGTRWRVATAADGRYRLADVPPGSYTVLVRRIGYAPERRPATVIARQEATVDVALQPTATQLGEVVVTAQKREERLQDVPLSIAVVTPEEIDRRGLLSAEDYLRGIPGVNHTPSSWGQTIVVRGIETSTGIQNFYSGATVATYFGETPTTGSQGVANGTNIDLKLVDIERVEVLRGPQGTAFGDASLGGAVRTIPVSPKLDRVEGKLGTSYSRTAGTGGNNYNVHGVANVPLVRDKLALRATAYRYEESGFLRNVAGSDPTFQSIVVAPYAAHAIATNEDHVGDTRFIGGRVAARFRASDALNFTVSYLTQKSEVDDWPIATAGSYDQALLEIAPVHAERGQKYGLLDSDIDIANATVEYDFGWANLLTTYSYLNSTTLYVLPFSAYSPWPVSYRSPSDHRGHIGEIRLTTQLEGAWNFLGGLYAENVDDDADWDAYWQATPETNFYAPGTAGPLGELHMRRHLLQKAAFGEVSWKVLPDVTLTGGARVYDYDRSERQSSEGPFFGDLAGTDRDSDASGATFRGNLSHKLTDNTLIYAGWSQGFRLGRPQSGLSPATCDPNGDGVVDGTSITIEDTRRLGSDKVNNYELGGKLTLLDRRLMIAADVYRVDWSDIPVTVSVETFGGPGREEGCFPVYVTNAGGARSEGLEFQANFYVTPAFRIDVGSSWTRARLTTDAPAINAFAGDRLPGSPEVNANLGLQYEFKLAGSPAFVRTDPIYVGPFYAGLRKNPQSKAGGYVKVDASARVTLSRTSVDLFVRNLTNEDEFTIRGPGNRSLGQEFSGYRLRPRTIGLQLGYNF